MSEIPTSDQKTLARTHTLDWFVCVFREFGLGSWKERAGLVPQCITLHEDAAVCRNSGLFPWKLCTALASAWPYDRR